MSPGPTAVRLAVFAGVLVLTLLPGLLWVLIPTEVSIFEFVTGYAWMWQILATLPEGIARVPYDGKLYFANTSQLVALTFWLLAGFATAVGLRRVRLRLYAWASLVVILISGMGAHLVLHVFGFAMYFSP